MKRLAVLLLLAALLTGPAQGAQARYLLRERGGAVCVYDAARGAWRDTGCPAARLPRAARAVLLCDESKLGRQLFCRIGPVGCVWRVVCDVPLGAEYTEKTDAQP